MLNYNNSLKLLYTKMIADICVSLWSCNFGILGQVWYLIVSITGLCALTYLYVESQLDVESYVMLSCILPIMLC